MKVSLEFGNKKVDQDQIEKGVEKMEKVNSVVEKFKVGAKKALNDENTYFAGALGALSLGLKYKGSVTDAIKGAAIGSGSFIVMQGMFEVFKD